MILEDGRRKYGLNDLGCWSRGEVYDMSLMCMHYWAFLSLFLHCIVTRQGVVRGRVTFAYCFLDIYPGSVDGDD